jgi:hypothetical protein
LLLVDDDQPVAKSSTRPGSKRPSRTSPGLLLVVGQLRSPDQLTGQRGGFGAVAPAPVAAALPDAARFRSSTESFSREYAFALRDGDL